MCIGFPNCFAPRTEAKVMMFKDGEKKKKTKIERPHEAAAPFPLPTLPLSQSCVPDRFGVRNCLGFL